MTTIIVVETTDLVKQWLMYLDSIIAGNYPEDLAINLYNVSSEDGSSAWEDFMSVPNVDRMELNPDDFTYGLSDILLDPIDRYFNNQGLEVVLIKGSKVVRTPHNDFTVYSTIEVKELEE